MRLMIITLALLSGACATEQTAGPAPYTGTAMFSCGVTDGPASRIDMASRVGGKISIFIHDISPEYLAESVPIKTGYYSESSAKLDYCPSRAMSCLGATDGTIRISRNTRKTVTGSIHFSDGSNWHDIDFTLKIVDPPHFTICG